MRVQLTLDRNRVFPLVMWDIRASSCSASCSCSAAISGASRFVLAKYIRLPIASSGLLISCATVADKRAAAASFSVRRNASWKPLSGEASRKTKTTPISLLESSVMGAALSSIGRK